LPQKQGSAHPNIAPYGDVFTTVDDREILLAVGSDRQFQDLCELLKVPDLANNPLFQTNQARVKHRIELKENLRACFSRLSSTEILPRLHQAKIPAGLIQDMKQVFEMPEAKELLLSADGLAGTRTIAFNSLSFNFSSHFLPPPHLGEHSHEILVQNLGYGAETIQNLKGAHIIR
jgi:crotonobetainyl-CoA:carnitine CoA-transferase CaiB-like acyl-CoA transferase